MAEQHRIISCPHCKQTLTWTRQNPHRPFCSKRCKLLDLGKWLGEEHYIPGDDGYDDRQVKPQEDSESK